MSNEYIYLIFSRTGTFLSKAIGVFTEGNYTHTSISFNDEFNKLYSFGRTNPDNPFSGGFVEESLYDGVYKKFTKSRCLIYKIKVTERQYIDLKEQVSKFCAEKNNYKYNLIGLFGVMLNKPIKRKNHYFCSQFVSEILIKSSIFNTYKLPELTKPEDLLQINNKDLVYEGLINKLYSDVANTFKLTLSAS